MSAIRIDETDYQFQIDYTSAKGENRTVTVDVFPFLDAWIDFQENYEKDSGKKIASLIGTDEKEYYRQCREFVRLELKFEEISVSASHRIICEAQGRKLAAKKKESGSSS